jgi:polar amino acid transport system substrate-binding protein
MKILKLIMTTLLLLMPFAETAKAELADILESGVVKIGVPESFPPFGSLNEEGEHVFEYDQ